MKVCFLLFFFIEIFYCKYILSAKQIHTYIHTYIREEACSRLHFDPNEHPENTLKAFQEFIQHFQLRYDALHPDTPKVSLEAAIERWKISQTTSENQSPKPNLEQFDEICEDTKARDKVTKFLGMYSSSRLYTDWCLAVPEEKTRKKNKME